MRPAREVGGDLYDLADLGGDKILITIGDVCGKGIPASLFMAVTQTVMRLTVRSEQSLEKEIGAANRLLMVNNSEDMFATLFCGVLEMTSGTMHYCNCGHNPPLLLQFQSGAFQSLRLCGPPLGLMDDTAYMPHSIVLAPGDILFLYTDGITEAENADRIQFGTAGLQESIFEVRDQSARSIVEHVVGEATKLANDASQSDDITCIAIVREK